MSIAEVNKIRLRLRNLKAQVDLTAIFDEAATTLSVTRPVATYVAKR